jgi:uncharacterized membrane protein (UPF0127 family)
MSQYRVIRNADTGNVLVQRAEWCQSYWCHFHGLMLRRTLAEDEALFFVYGQESVVNSSIHMFFMNFAIATIWLDSKGTVVDTVLAKPWRPAYFPSKPAQYILEAHPSRLDLVQKGARLVWE